MSHANSKGDGAIFEMKSLDLPISRAKHEVGDDMNLCWDFNGLSGSDTLPSSGFGVPGAEVASESPAV